MTQEIIGGVMYDTKTAEYLGGYYETYYAPYSAENQWSDGGERSCWKRLYRTKSDKYFTVLMLFHFIPQDIYLESLEGLKVKIKDPDLYQKLFGAIPAA